jgi:hypothetical protein
MKTLYLRACVPVCAYLAALRLYMVRNARAYYTVKKMIGEIFFNIRKGRRDRGYKVKYRTKVFDRFKKIREFLVRKPFLADHSLIEYFWILIFFNSAVKSERKQNPAVERYTCRVYKSIMQQKAPGYCMYVRMNISYKYTAQKATNHDRLIA